MPRLLIVTLADLGDALLTTPALRALRQSLPDAHLTILTTPTGALALRDQPLHDEIITFQKQRFNTRGSLLRPANLRYAVGLWRALRRGSYDGCIILRHLTTWPGAIKHAAIAWASGADRCYGLDNGRGWFLTDRVFDGGFGARHEAEYWLDVVALLGAQTGDRRPSYGDSPAAAPHDPQMIALHPGSGSFAPARRWPYTRWAALADALIEDGFGIALVGGPEEGELRGHMLHAMRHADRVLDVGGRTTLPELGALLRRCALFVGNDSGVTHLAASVGTPTVAIFGPTDPRAWGPYGGEEWRGDREWANGVAVLRSGTHRALRASIACSPCIYRDHRLGTPNGCPDRTCLGRIAVDQPLQLIRQRLRELAGNDAAQRSS